MICLWSGRTTNGRTIGIDFHRADRRLLPVRPEWTGLLLDTVFYALILSTFAFYGPLRRHRRTRRGRCARCAYDLAGDLEAGCPECGWRRDD
jgi:hypothetical protein